jgi:hypothetical protein
MQRAGVPAAAVLAVATVAPLAPVAGASPRASDTSTRADGPPRDRSLDRLALRASRSALRQEPSAATLAEVQGLAAEYAEPDLVTRWTTAALNVWTGPGEDTKLLTVIDSREKVRFTGETDGPWAQIQRGERAVWVRKVYLARKKPAAGEPGSPGVPRGTSGAPCPDGSSIESGLTARAVEVYRAVCAAFPAVTSWGGYRPGGGDHGSGRAIDVMASGSFGSAIASYVRAHASELGVSQVIYAQRIWTADRAGDGWRYMSDRGSPTANHYDHVHVAVY